MNSDLLVRHLEEEMSAVPAQSSAIREVVRRGRRRRRGRRAAWGALVLATAFLFVMFPIPFDPNPKALAGAYQVPFVVEISDLEVAVESETPALVEPDVWLGWMHPRPEFDTSNLGPDLTLGVGTPSVDDLGGRVLSAVYLGESEGEPFYIYAVEPPTIFDRVSEIASGNLSGQILGTSHGCCSGGDMDIEGGLPGMSTARSGDEEPVVTAEWLGITPDISVVAILLGDRYVGWQTPIGGVISMRLDHEPGAEVSLVAFAADGQEMQRFGPWPMADLDLAHIPAS